LSLVNYKYFNDVYSELSGAFFWHIMHLHYNEFPARCLLIKHHFWLRPCLLENVGLLYRTNNIIICFKLSKSKTVAADLIT